MVYRDWPRHTLPGCLRYLRIESLVARILFAGDLTLPQGTQTATEVRGRTDHEVASAASHTPIAHSDNYEIVQDSQLTVPDAGVLANDTDADHDPLTADLVTTTNHGRLSFSPNGSFTYTPNSGFSGTDTFTYRVSDGSNHSLASVILNVHAADHDPHLPDAPASPVNHVPIAHTDSYEISQDTPLVDGPGVLVNDTDSDHDPLEAELAIGPVHGELVFESDGGFTYTPESGFSGTDTFAYRVSDGLDHSVATVVIHIQRPNPLHNFVQSHDVNGDSIISPVDALTVINHLNSDYSLSIAEAEAASASFLDVNDDGYISAVDALMVINVFNSKAFTGQGEATTRDVAVIVETGDHYDASTAWIDDGPLDGPRRRRLL